MNEAESKELGVGGAADAPLGRLVMRPVRVDPPGLPVVAPVVEAATVGGVVEPSAAPARAAVSLGARRRRRRVAVLVGVVGGALALAGGGTLLALALAQAAPGWWRAIDPASPAVKEAAQRVENGAATQLTKIRKAETLPSAPGLAAGTSEPWTIKLTSADANAWLAARLRPWLESQEEVKFIWPRELERIEVEFDGGRIYVGALVNRAATEKKIAGAAAGDRRQYLSAALRPELRSDGALWMPATTASVGRLLLPPSWMIPKAKSSRKEIVLPGDFAQVPGINDILRALAGDRPAMQQAIIKIGDGRRVKILGLEPRDGALYITCQTLPRETGRAEK
jgi:hypothetical protein